MTTPNPSLYPVESRDAEPPEALGQIFQDAPQWPVTRLAAVMLTAGVAGSMVLLPVTAARLRGASSLALLLPAILATVTARVLFESIAPARPRHLRCHLLPATISAVPATAFFSLSALVVGLQWSLEITMGTLALNAGALTAAGAVRDIEIRLRMSLRRVFFVGAAAPGRDLARELARRSDANFVGSNLASEFTEPSRLVSAVLKADATVLILDRDAMGVRGLVEAASELNLRGVRVRDLVGYYESEFKKVPLSELSPTWFLFDIAGVHRGGPWLILRRGLEIVLAAVLLAMSVPFLVLSFVAIRLTSQGPALYRQRRVGRDGVAFTLLKLRTMTLAEADEAAWAGSQGHRATPLGLILRRFRLDELPQLVNVIRGDLALIGPRPEQVSIAEQLERGIPFYSARHTVRPGLTGWAQVTLGYAGSKEGTLAKLQRDLYYIKYAGWRLDALILWLTIKAIVTNPN